MAKDIWRFLENLFEYYEYSNILNIVVNINFFSDLNITVSTNFKYYHKQGLNKKLNLMGGAIKYFPEKLLGHEILSSIVPWATKFFFEKFVIIRPPPTYLMCAP